MTDRQLILTVFLAAVAGLVGAVVWGLGVWEDGL